MKSVTIALAFAGLLAAQDKTDPDKVTVTAQFENTSLAEIVDGLGSLTGVPIAIDDAAKKKVDLKTASNFNVKDITLTQALKLLFGGHGLEVKVVDKTRVLITVPKGK